MKTVKINRDKLVAIVRENRETHLKEYEEAKAKLLHEFRSKLETVIRDAGGVLSGWAPDPDIVDSKVTARVAQVLGLTIPKSYATSYDSVVRMLELSEDEIIELSHDEFNHYVMDEWEWSRSFTMSNSALGVQSAAVKLARYGE